VQVKAVQVKAVQVKAVQVKAVQAEPELLRLDGIGVRLGLYGSHVDVLHVHGRVTPALTLVR
jgi:hypothetical protein